MSHVRYVLIGLGLSVGCISDAPPGVDVDGTVGEPDVAPEVASCGAEECAADNACRAEGEVNPTNTCEVCDPTRDRNGWSAALGDKPCDDGDNCTGSGTCNGGLCMVGAATSACDVVAECIEGCDAQCNLVIAEGTCFIDGACHVAGGGASDDDCRTCQPAQSQLAWSGTNADCDDNDGCTYADICTDEGCVGVPNLCDDGRACTSDFCDGGQCQHPITDGCLVGNACVAQGAAGAAGPCFVCKPDVSRTTLSIANNAPCEDGDVCTAVSTCQADGQCAGNVASVDDEPNETLALAQDLGTADGGEFPSGEILGNIRSDGDVDVFRWGMPFEVGGVVMSPRAAISNVAMPVDLCVFATCGQTSQTAAAPTLTCPPGSTKENFGNAAVEGCCRSVTDGEGALQLDALCVSVTSGFGYAAVRPIGATDADSCGGYELRWGTAR